MGINDIIQIGNKIKELRKLKGISQKEMAELIGVNRSTYSNYENNNREPDMHTIQKIADALDTTTANLLGINVPHPKQLEIIEKLSTQMQENSDEFKSSTVGTKAHLLSAYKLGEMLSEVSDENNENIWMLFNTLRNDIYKDENAISCFKEICKYINIDITSYTNNQVLKTLNSSTFKSTLLGLLEDISKDSDN